MRVYMYFEVKEAQIHQRKVENSIAVYESKLRVCNKTIQADHVAELLIGRKNLNAHYLESLPCRQAAQFYC